eukprot:988726-Rhodomonas_salina.1
MYRVSSSISCVCTGDGQARVRSSIEIGWYRTWYNECGLRREDRAVVPASKRLTQPLVRQPGSSIAQISTGHDNRLGTGYSIGNP